MNAEVLSETLKDKNILVTGGTGSFGHHIVPYQDLPERTSVSVRIV
ncbi:MAG: hypothetical protein IIB56_19180 [Planctomycetes bacterium]|nr:hypothetical protein [Planctomycetota bacterium]